jgi:hypothetical protein
MTPPAPTALVTPTAYGGPSVDVTLQIIAAHATIRAVRRFLKTKRCYDRLNRETTEDTVLAKWRLLALSDYQDAERHLVRTILAWRKGGNWNPVGAERRLWRAAGVSWRGWLYLVVPDADTLVTEEGQAGADDEVVMRLVTVQGTAVAGLPDQVVDLNEARQGVLNR